MSDADLIKDAQSAFEAAQEVESEWRQEARDDLRFVKLLEQWPEAIRKDRELDGRPCLTIDILNPVIRQVLNDARQNKPAISVHPVDSAGDPETAEILSGLIRQIEQSSDAEVAYDTALDFAVCSGIGYLKVNTRYAHDDSFDQDIVIERVANPFAIYRDPRSTAADSSDWNVAFELDSLTKADFERRYKDAEPSSFAGAEEFRVDGAEAGDEITIASYWTREQSEKTIVALDDGQILDEEVYVAQKELFDALGVTVTGSRKVPCYDVTQRIMGGGDVLETVEWAGKYIPIIPVYGDEANVEGQRYFGSLVRNAKDPQRMFNYWRTTTTELVALAPKAPFIGRKGVFAHDIEKWQTANTQSHAFIEYDGAEAPQRQPFSGVPAGALQEAMNASDDVKRVTGIYEASLGARSNETSGKAIMARQREGDVSTFHYIDNLSRAIRHTGRVIVDLIPKVYAAPRILRTLGPNNEERAVVAAPKEMQGNLPPEMMQVVQQQQQAVAEDMERQEQLQEVSKIYDLSTGKYDVTVKVGPSFTSRREEAATQMIELIRAFPQAAPVLGDLLAENLDWPGAEKVAERLQKLLPPQLQGGEDPRIAEAGQVIQQMQAQMVELQQQANDKQADAMIKARELEIRQFEAETDRLKVEADLIIKSRVSEQPREYT